MGYSYTIIFKNTPLPAILKKRLLKFCVVNVIPLTNIFAEIMNSYAVGSYQSGTVPIYDDIIKKLSVGARGESAYNHSCSYFSKISSREIKL